MDASDTVQIEDYKWQPRNSPNIQRFTRPTASILHILGNFDSINSSLICFSFYFDLTVLAWILSGIFEAKLATLI